MKVSEKLLKKYNVPVPRYTSYPPANHFPDEFSDGDYRAMLKESNSGRPELMAIYIHIPFCKKICFYCGCNACGIGKGRQVDTYFKALKKEIEMVAATLDKKRLVSQIHYGGGTPNAVPAKYITSLNEFLFETFNFIDQPEIAIECHPAYLDEAYIEQLLRAKFNRFSLGIQDFNPDVLRQVNREPSLLPVQELIPMIKKHNSGASVNLDFIYGLPGQSAENFSRTIEQAVRIRPDRLVTFSYAHVPWVKKHQQILEKRGIPDPEEKIAMFLAAYGILSEAGYKPIGLDHFVLPDDELFLALENNMLHRNFQGYCTRKTTGQVYAFGASAISQLEKGYSQNIKDVDDYIALVRRKKLPTVKGLRISHEQMIIREAITDLMCNKRINWSMTAERTGITGKQLSDILAVNRQDLDEFVADGLIEMTNEEISVTETGALFIRNIAASFDPAFLSSQQKYSRSI
ncbi:MAG: oxygen-independent coproporphyrinogen III oxidase [Bacteroidales bacterium]|nr:oxygen-independent coproporphyrinogen III oxidase [Bacteroidales bacterium]